MVKQTRTELRLNDTDDLVQMLVAASDGSYTWTPNEIEWEDGWDEVEIVDEVSKGSGRWTEHMLTIVNFRGKLYGIEWESGLTEEQEDEFYPSNRSVYEVDKTEKVVYTYSRKSS